MREIPPDLAARLTEGATTLCRCWALTRRDGTVLGFTDHDRDLVVSGITYAARTGLEAAEASAELGFAVSGGDVAGALSSLGLTEADIAAGLYDGASVETWLVDWSSPQARILLDLSGIGEIRRSGNAFVAELRGLMDQLDVERGRSFRAACGADLGDARCRVDLVGYRTTGTVSAVPEQGTLETVLAGSFSDGFFTGGKLTWTAGANAGRLADVRAQTGGRIELWETPTSPPAIGDAFTLTAGCDKSLSTCAQKFANVANFQGFPHMPGNDFVLRQSAATGSVLDGGSLFRR